MNLKLGKQPPRLDERTLRLSKYLVGAPPPPPTKTYWEYSIGSWGMMKNDDLGDCTCAAAGHLEMSWSKHAGREFFPSDDQIVSAYTAVSGYDPATGLNDNGAIELDVLNYWRQVGIAGKKITAYAALDVGNIDHIKQAVWIFGGAYIGVQLPVSAQSQGDVWDAVSNDGGVWGGHAVPVLGYGEKGCTVITWGKLQRMTWEFWKKYCDEAYAVLSPDWVLFKEGQHFSLEEMESDLVDITAH